LLELAVLFGRCNNFKGKNMSEKKRMKTVCIECKEEFSFFKEPKGVLLIECPFCASELKIEFEDNSKKILYKSLKVK
jgi:rRNA maturation endonuclease Nob1